MFDSLKELEESKSFQVFSFEKDFISVCKQKNPNFLNQLKAIRQNSETDLNNIDFLVRTESDLSPITAKSRPK